MESYRILTGAPSKYYINSQLTAQAAFSIIDSALKSNYLIGVDTSSSNPYGLATGHAHTIVKTYQILNSNGQVTNRLIKIRNPWGLDSYTGPWSDSDTSRWNANTKAQAGFVNNTQDGYFYMEDVNFIVGFYYFTVNFVNDSFTTSYYEKIGDDGMAKNYTFTLRQNNQPVYVQGDFFDPRMYAYGCRGANFTNGSFSVYT